MRRRLALTAAATTAMVAVAFVLPLAFLIRTVAEDRALRAAEQEAQSLVAVLATTTEPAVAASVVAGAGGPDRVVTVFRADGAVLGAAGEADAAVTEARAGRAFTADTAGGKEVLVPVVVAGGGVDVIRVFVPDRALRRGVLASWALLAVLGAVLVAVGVAVADRLGRSVVRPMSEAADVARRLGQGDLDARASPGGPPEVVAVAQALNQLAGRIRDLLAAEREGVADLSHRLRTPLAALRLEAEGLGEGPGTEGVVAATDDVIRAVDQLIAEARRPLRRAGTDRADVAAVVRERVAFWEPLADEEDRRVGVDTPGGPVLVRAHPDDLAAAVDALIGNVLAHTPAGTPFRVAVTSDGDSAVLLVADEGPGLAHPGALERGVSGGGSTGLGLDIVRRTAEAAGGRLRVDNGPGGRGLRVRVELPIAGA